MYSSYSGYSGQTYSDYYDESLYGYDQHPNGLAAPTATANKVQQELVPNGVNLQSHRHHIKGKHTANDNSKLLVKMKERRKKRIRKKIQELNDAKEGEKIQPDDTVKKPKIKKKHRKRRITEPTVPPLIATANIPPALPNSTPAVSPLLPSGSMPINPVGKHHRRKKQSVKRRLKAPNTDQMKAATPAPGNIPPMPPVSPPVFPTGLPSVFPPVPAPTFTAKKGEDKSKKVKRRRHQ